MKEIPILLYHNSGCYPSEMTEDGLLPESFENQMLYLAANGYNFVTLNKALEHLKDKNKAPPKSIAMRYLQKNQPERLI
jgi:hypothetical protein